MTDAELRELLRPHVARMAGAFRPPAPAPATFSESHEPADGFARPATFYAAAGFTADDAEGYARYFAADDDGHYPGDVHRYFGLNVRDFADRSKLVRKQIETTTGRRWYWVNPEKGKHAGKEDTPAAPKPDADAGGRHATLDAENAVSKALAAPHELAAEHVEQLAQHLDTLPRDRLRDLARQVQVKMGSRKAELVQRLLDHVKGRHDPSQAPGAALERGDTPAEREPGEKAEPDLSGHQTIAPGKKLRVGEAVRGTYSTPSGGDRPFTGVVTGYANEQGSRGPSQYGTYSVKLDPGSEIAKDRSTLFVTSQPDGKVEDDRFYVPHPSTRGSRNEQERGGLDGGPVQPADVGRDGNGKPGGVDVREAKPAAGGDRGDAPVGAINLPPEATNGKPSHELTREQYARRWNALNQNEAHEPGGRIRTWDDELAKAGPHAAEMSRWLIHDLHGPGHRAAVEEALKAGKPVPPEVLKDYPDLAPPAPRPSPADRIDAELSPADRESLRPDRTPAPGPAPEPATREPTLEQLETGVRPGGGPRAKHLDPLSSPYRVEPPRAVGEKPSELSRGVPGEQEIEGQEAPDRGDLRRATGEDAGANGGVPVAQVAPQAAVTSNPPPAATPDAGGGSPIPANPPPIPAHSPPIGPAPTPPPKEPGPPEEPPENTSSPLDTGSGSGKVPLSPEPHAGEGGTGGKKMEATGMSRVDVANRIKELVDSDPWYHAKVYATPGGGTVRVYFKKDTGGKRGTIEVGTATVNPDGTVSITNERGLRHEYRSHDTRDIIDQILKLRADAGEAGPGGPEPKVGGTNYTGGELARVAKDVRAGRPVADDDAVAAAAELGYITEAEAMNRDH